MAERGRKRGVGRIQPVGSVQDQGCVQPGALAIGYARVSTEEQARHGISLDAQVERIRAYCTLNNLALEKIICDEGVSGTKRLTDRPGGAQVVSLVTFRQAGHVVALKLDRLFRDAEDALHQTKAWDRAGVALHLIDLGGAALNTQTAMGRFFLNMMAGFAELERNLIAERTATALGHLKRTRQVYGPVPFGFVVSQGGLVVHPDEGAVVRQILDWRRQGWTLRAIANELNRLSVVPKRGGQAWYASTVRRILQNRIHQAA